MKLSNYCFVLVYILQTLALLMARRCRVHHMIQVWILMMTIKTWPMSRMIMIRMRPVQQRDMLLLMVHRYRLFLGVVDLRLDIGWSWETNSFNLLLIWAPDLLITETYKPMIGCYGCGEACRMKCKT